ncbi:hypothetical protein RUM44_011934 [Polyplax serrata]|uniref:LYR motif-containing protein 5 n=1 Tax=Polyplax serrata TaxID=468196 RepID=A0ABR1B9W3_POLSC
MSAYKSTVKNLYKTLLYMGRDYPLGYDYFRVKCHDAFWKNRSETDPAKIRQMIRHGRYMVKELEALYRLKKYRTLKKMYYNQQTDELSELLNKISKHS